MDIATPFCLLRWLKCSLWAYLGLHPYSCPGFETLLDLLLLVDLELLQVQLAPDAVTRDCKDQRNVEQKEQADVAHVEPPNQDLCVRVRHQIHVQEEVIELGQE